jgi:hypothetical protein
MQVELFCGKPICVRRLESGRGELPSSPGHDCGRRWARPPDREPVAPRFGGHEGLVSSRPPVLTPVDELSPPSKSGMPTTTHGQGEVRREDGRTHDMTPRTRHRNLATAAAGIAAAAPLATGLGACDASGQPHAHDNAATVGHHAQPEQDAAAEVRLHTAMRQLWVEHMEWTYATVAAFAADSEGLSATLDRLLQNQADIGDAVKPFYGEEAGAALTRLLEDHINGAVPILVAARDGDKKALQPAVADWYRNARAIADFLARANPSWEQGEMRTMMKGHIDQTLAYATAQLQGDYVASIKAYGTAEQHMLHMADMLSDGLVEQFPDRFAS